MSTEFLDDTVSIIILIIRNDNKNVDKNQFRV